MERLQSVSKLLGASGHLNSNVPELVKAFDARPSMRSNVKSAHVGVKTRHKDYKTPVAAHAPGRSTGLRSGVAN